MTQLLNSFSYIKNSVSANMQVILSFNNKPPSYEMNYVN
ncbi:hypothetical protein SAMN05192562_104370 [Kosakonia arachidis]|uniref:Uncharacterized protein n=1 Tax=Kosakonia arachidis TaxID=551989 RepID=A0A1I7D3G4_9ENTR|nr:hypothetical protein SAMN05192562_104370 [Kosakonia arachidis]